jgi:SAM-dependent methyltransferase
LAGSGRSTKGRNQVLSLNQLVSGIPLFGGTARKVGRALKLGQRPFPGSPAYWEERYATGGDSGVGSYGKFAEFKAEVINSFVAQNRIESVIEFGCGDGNQLALANYPRYMGFDVSSSAVERCRNRFSSDPTKSFYLLDEYAKQTADMALSLDVIFHLVEDDVFESYMHRLCGAATRFVVIYSSDTNENNDVGLAHIRHRKFSAWIRENASGWELKQHIPNRYPYDGDYQQTSFADFYIYAKTE